MRVAAEDHAADARLDLAHVLMDDRDVRRNEVGSVFFGGGKAEHMVVLVDGAADRAQRIVAVCERVRERELLQPARLRRLDDTDVGDVVRGDRVKFEFEVLFRPAVVRVQDAVGHRPLAGRSLLVSRQERLAFFDERAAHVIAAAADEFDHCRISFIYAKNENGYDTIIKRNGRFVKSFARKSAALRLFRAEAAKAAFPRGRSARARHRPARSCIQAESEGGALSKHESLSKARSQSERRSRTAPPLRQFPDI